MSQPLIIPQLDAQATERIEQESQHTGVSIEIIVRRLIYRGLEAERQQDTKQRYHDLDALAGTWTDEDVDEFQRAIEHLSQVEPSLW